MNLVRRAPSRAWSVTPWAFSESTSLLRNSMNWLSCSELPTAALYDPMLRIQFSLSSRFVNTPVEN